MTTKISRAEEKLCGKASYALAVACHKGAFSLDSNLWDRACELMGEINRYINSHRKADRRT